MKVLLAALPSLPDNDEGNLAGLERAMREGSGAADLVVVAEAFGQGIEAITDDPAHDLAIAWDAHGPEVTRVRDWARRESMAVCMGFIERDGDVIHSSAIVIDRDGQDLALYRRNSRGWRGRSTDALPEVYADGTETVAFELCGKGCTVALCGDGWDMPERFAAVGAEVLLWPMFRTCDAVEWETSEVQAYAEQAARMAPEALLVGSLTYDGGPPALRYGAATWLSHGEVRASLPMGEVGSLLVEIP